MRSLDRLLAANEKLLKILIFSKTVQNTSKSFQTADLFANVTMNLYTNEIMARYLFAGTRELLKVSMFGKKRMMSLLPTEITGCSNVLYAKLIIC